MTMSVRGGSVSGMPKPAQTEGDPQEVVPMQVKLPRWMKNGALEKAKARGQDLSEYIRDLIRRELEK